MPKNRVAENQGETKFWEKVVFQVMIPTPHTRKSMATPLQARYFLSFLAQVLVIVGTQNSGDAWTMH